MPRALCVTKRPWEYPQCFRLDDAFVGLQAQHLADLQHDGARDAGQHPPPRRQPCRSCPDTPRNRFPARRLGHFAVGIDDQRFIRAFFHRFGARHDVQDLLVVLKEASASLAGIRNEEVIRFHSTALSKDGAACRVITTVGLLAPLGAYPRAPGPRVNVTRRIASGI